MNKVSSRGCYRSFILCVLWRCLDYARKCWKANIPVSTPFGEEEIMNWIVEATADIHSSTDFPTLVGDFDFNEEVNHSAYMWNEASQFSLWWKNNIERHSKFQVLVRDALITDRDRKSIARQVIALSINIKNHQRIKGHQNNPRIVHQLNLPTQMPLRLPREAIELNDFTIWRDFDDYLTHISQMENIRSNIAISSLDEISPDTTTSDYDLVNSVKSKQAKRIFASTTNRDKKGDNKFSRNNCPSNQNLNGKVSDRVLRSTVFPPAFEGGTDISSELLQNVHGSKRKRTSEEDSVFVVRRRQPARRALLNSLSRKADIEETWIDNCSSNPGCEEGNCGDVIEDVNYDGDGSACDSWSNFVCNEETVEIRSDPKYSLGCQAVQTGHYYFAASSISSASSAAFSDWEDCSAETSQHSSSSSTSSFCENDASEILFTGSNSVFCGHVDEKISFPVRYSRFNCGSFDSSIGSELSEVRRDFPSVPSEGGGSEVAPLTAISSAKTCKHIGELSDLQNGFCLDSTVLLLPLDELELAFLEDLKMLN